MKLFYQLLGIVIGFIIGILTAISSLMVFGLWVYSDTKKKPRGSTYKPRSYSPGTTKERSAKEEIDQKVREVDYYGGNPPAWRTGVVKENVDGSRSYFTEDMLKEKEEAGDLEDILSGMSPDQRDLFYLTMKFALEEMIEEQEEIKTFGDNLKFVAPRRTPPYTHLDL